jgi:hypothetical protein
MKGPTCILISFCFAMTLGCSSVLVGDTTSGDKVSVYIPNEGARLVSFYGGDPEGFDGIKWETKLSTLERMKHYRTDPSHGGIEFYLKEGEGFRLGNGKLAPIQYGFLKEKFYVGMVTTEGTTDWNALKEVVFNKFGVGAKAFMNREEYLWIGRNAVMALRYDEISKNGLLYIRCDSMRNRMQDIL